MPNILCSHIQMNTFQNDKSYANRPGIQTKAGSMRNVRPLWCGAQNASRGIIPVVLISWVTSLTLDAC